MNVLRPRLGSLDPRIGTRTAQVERIRGSRLQAIRRSYFRQHPLCVECLKQGRPTPATELDHVIPLHQGGQDVHGNRQGLCAECHAEKSAGEERKRRGQA